MDFIDTLRGMACLWVLLHHSLGDYHGAKRTSNIALRAVVEVANLGWLGVSLFLVLSGFCLYYPLVRRSEIAFIEIDLKKFATRRARRILPPYYAALFLYIAITLFATYRHHRPIGTGFANALDIPAHILMVHNLMPATFASISGVFWSLALESQLYVVFPLLIIIAAKFGLRSMLLITLFIAVLWQTIVFFFLGFSSGWTPTLGTWYHALPGRCFEFACGMAAAFYVSNPKQKVTRYCSICVPVLLVIGVIYASLISRFGPLLDPIWGLVFFCTIILLSGVPENYFKAKISLRWLTWTGTISYSLYLVHALVFQYVKIPENPGVMLLVMLALRFAVSIVVAYLFFLSFERPFLLNKRKASTDMIESTVASPAP